MEFTRKSLGLNRKFVQIISTSIFSMLLLSCSSTPPKLNETLQQTGDRLPVEAFFRNPLQSSFEISPNGKFISYLAPWQGRMNIFVRPTDQSSQPVRLTDVTDRDIAHYFWKGVSTIVYLRDFAGDENYQLFAVNLNSHKVIALTPFPGARSTVIDDLERIDDLHILVGINQRNPQVFDAFRLNVQTGELVEIARNPGNISSWITDHLGRLRVAITSDGVNNSLLVRQKESDKFRPLLTTNFRESVDPFFFTFDNKNLYVASNRGRDKSAIVILDLTTAKEKLIFQHPDVDMSNLSYSRKRHVLWTAVYTTAKTERHFFDHEIKTIFDEIQRQLPNLEIGIMDTDRDETLFLVRASSDINKGSFFIYDKQKKLLSKLTDVAPWLPPDQMSEMRSIEYKARDGLLIHGYLTIPRGRTATHLPVIVNPHGGPWHRDTWGFDSEVQFLASRGYAVFQPNFRGSTGYGRKFWEASFKQWGKKMQDDLTDGVNWLVEQGLADPNRIAIYGGSYGGYATLAGLAFTPDLYACGIDYVGVSNLFTFMNTIPPYWRPFLQMMYEKVGDPKKDITLLHAASPVFHVDQIKAPLFVAQGAKDPRVNIDESNQIVNALRKRGVAVEYMVKENEGHGFHNEENRFDFYRHMETFLQAHL